MANALFDKGRNAFAEGLVTWKATGGSVIHAMLVRTVAGAGAGANAVYTANLATDQFLSSIPNNTYCRVADVALTTLDPVAGVCDANDFTFTAVPAGDAAQAIVVYHSTGVDTTSDLIAYIDTATGLPITPNGGDLTITVDNGANKLFKL